MEVEGEGRPSGLAASVLHLSCFQDLVEVLALVVDILEAEFAYGTWKHQPCVMIRAKRLCRKGISSSIPSRGMTKGVKERGVAPRFCTTCPVQK